MKQKIMVLYYDKEGETEEYTIELPKGVSKLTAVAHMFRAAAEGILEIQQGLLKALDGETNLSDTKEDTLP